MAKGNPANPMTDAELDHKFLLLTRDVLGERAAPVLARLHEFDQLADVGAFLRTLDP